ncbi:MAG UNVERIFIED_CONTAM: tagaturonate epimerase family protein [Planctomycetaceae bacterium]
MDFIGDLAALERSLADHAAIARLAGPYKLSLHSGSDKLSMYSLLSLRHRRPVPCQDRRHQLSGGAPSRREVR